jgi:transcription elongation factor GreA
MLKKEFFLTPEGADKIRAELNVLKDVKRPELSARLRHAISMGDLSENADYIATKEEQAFLEGKIQELETILREATIIEDTGVSDRVELGSVVRITDGNSEILEYKIVGVKEADPRNGKISNESPIGQALLGKQKGEVATANTPAGMIEFKIVEILGN